MTRSTDSVNKAHWTPAQWEIFNAFGDASYIRDHMDIQAGRLWDSVTYAAGSTITQSNSALFSNVGPTSGKSKSDSNMVRSNTLLCPESFAIKRVIFTFNTAALNEDVYTFAEEATFFLWIGKKHFLHNLLISMHTAYGTLAPLRICEYCSGVYVSNETCPGCGAASFRLSDIGCTEEAPGRQFYMDVSPPIVLRNQMFFLVDFSLNPFTTRERLKIWCHFEGLHARGVS